eukprot:TRINITY_DN10851_c0_g1_i1.p1 TRINITY_DN10851_c0_g1~~TRINITY_DN10851_c0_g1_i1.p1  ORF type:complete len:1341 (+),score=523.18 TRINITY_DN10851_c0_g1_i1:181-4203(+)
MNNYQIYEEIGRGKHSTVYKGRKKKTIEYYAIKSVEKSQRTRVLNEVTMLHQLSHPNVLQFYHWYETNNHLWLIVEYCTGADVLSLIKQDKSLPEDTLTAFAHDIVQALAYIHSKGIIYCDLKPSNMLVDAHGFLKLSDFGLACHVDDVTPEKRRIGTPSYMAPELFQEGGVPSFSTDLSSLGCVLYEIFVGHPPFMDPKVDALIKKVVYDDFAPPQGASREFNDLLEGLLEKDPLDRLDWPELLAHDFWMSRQMPQELKLPAQPAFERYKARRSTEPTGSRREARERRRKEVARVAAAAQQNLVRERAGATYSDKRHADGLEADTELDFREQDDDEAPQDEEDQSPALNPAVPAAVEAAAEGGVNVAAPAEPPLPAAAAQGTLKDGEQREAQGGAAAAPAGAAAAQGGDAAAGAAIGDVNALLFHPNDSVVKPIMCNTRIEKIPEAKYDAQALPFPAHTFEQVCGMQNAELEGFLTQIYKSIGGHTTIGEKYNNLCYFETLCTDTQTANLFINSSLMVLFIKMVQNSEYPQNLKARLCMVMGLLIRHATYIGPDLAQTGIVAHLLHLFEDKSIRVRRRAVACLGELLFYIATQQEKDRTPWHISQSVATQFHRALQSDDECVRHYCVKTLENITGHSDASYSRHFASKEAAEALAASFLPGERQARNEHLRASSVSTLSRLCRAHHPCLRWAIADFGVGGVAAQLVNAGSTRTLQSVLNIFNQVLCKVCLVLRNGATRPGDEDDLFASLEPRQGVEPAPQPPGPQEPENIFKGETFGEQEAMRILADIGTHAKDIVHGLMASLEHSSAVIRGKAMLCVHLLTVCDLRYLALCGDCKLFSILERCVGKERDGYLVCCFATFCAMLTAAVALIVNRLAVQLQQQGGQQAASEFLAVALHALTSNAVRSAATSAEVILGLARCLSAAEAASAKQQLAQGEGSAVQQCLLMAEALAQEGGALRKHHQAVTRQLLPVLARLLASENGDTRFMSLKIFIDVLTHFFADPDIYPASPSPSGGAASADGAPPAGSTAAELDSILLTQLFPRLPALLDDEEPIPLYGLKLLNNIASRSPDFFVPHIAQTPELVPKLFAFFKLEHRNNNVHNVRLVYKVVACEAIPYQLVFDLGVVSKLGGVLAYAFENTVETFFEPCLDICHTLLWRTMQVGQRWQEGGRTDAAAGEEYETRRRHCLPLKDNVELYAVLAVGSEVAETAAHCLMLCAQLFPSVELHTVIVSERVRGNLRASLLEHSPAGGEGQRQQDAAPSSIATCKCVLRTLVTVLRSHPPPPQGPDFAAQLRRDDLLIVGVRSLASLAAAPAVPRGGDPIGELAAIAQQVISMVYT